MRVTVNGLSLFRWCNENDKNYQKIRYELLNILKEKKKRAKRTAEEIRLDNIKRFRMKAGYSEEEASLPKEKFMLLTAQRYCTHKIGNYGLKYVCEKLGINYHTVFQYCIRRKKIAPEEYLTAKGYDLSQFKD